MNASKFICASLICIAPLAQAEIATNLPPVVARYEQILIKSPEKGAAFDKVYQHYFENEGLEKLTEHWKQAASSYSDTKAAEPYQILLGLLAERRGNANESRAAYTLATKYAPEDYRAWRALGDLEAREGKFPAAIAALEKAMASNPPASERTPLYRQLARSHQRNLDNPSALATWQKMADEFPTDPFVIEEVAEAQLEAEKFEEAKKTFTRLRDLAGTDPFKKITATIRMAQVEERQGKPKEALAIYESALPQASETSWIHRDVRSRIEDVYRRQDDLPGLVAYYEKWIGNHDKDVEAAIRLSAALVELNRKKDATGWLRCAVEWAPDRREIQIELAKMLCETDQADAAQKILATLTQQAPEELSYWELLGSTEWQLFKKTNDAARKKAALDAWNKLAPADAKDATRVSRLADLLREKGLDEEALSQFERAVSLAPDASDLRERRAAYLFELKRDDAAWKTLDELVTGDRANAGNYQRLATVQAKYGKLDLALASVKKGLELSPNDYSLFALEWRILSEMKDWDGAAALYPQMLAASPAMATQTDQQYLQALQAANKLEEVKKGLAAKVENASEDELRLLTRMALQSDDLSTAHTALDEGKKRNANSIPLAQLEADYAKRTGKLDAQVAAYRRLIELSPKQSGDFLQQIARAYQEQQQWDKAIAVAEEWIKSSPANSDAQIFCADINFAANKSDAGIDKLHEAIKLSDKPNQIRQRLAQAYAQVGDMARARQTTEEAFEGEQDAGAKLGLVRQLSELYFQAGKIDVLIARFRERQRSEEGGWRYAVYLSEIFQQMQDYSQAREELAKSLASRPKDPVLIKQLLRLADQEDNTAEKARYYKVLSEVEPSVANFASLAEALANNGDGPGAIQVLLAHESDILKDPEPWRMSLARVQKEPAAATLNTALENTLRQRPDDFRGRMIFAEIQIALGNLDLAQRLLWELRAMPQPANSVPVTATTAGQNPMGMYNLFGSAFSGLLGQRISAVSNAQQSFAELLDASQSGGRYRRFRSFQPSFFRYNFGNQPQTNSTPGYTEIRDKSLVYLAAVAVKQDKAEAFIAALEKELTAQNADRKERLACYAMVQARDLIWREIQAQAESPTGGIEMDGICLGLVSQFIFGRSDGANPEKEKAMDIMRKLSDRIRQADPKSVQSLSMTRYFTMAQCGKKEEAQAEAKKLLEQPFDENDPGQLQFAFQAALGADELERAETFAAKLSALTKKNKSRGMDSTWLKFSLGQSYIAKKDVKNAARLYAAAFTDSLPAQRGGTSTNRIMFYGGIRSSYRNGNLPAVPYPNSYIDDQRISFLRQAYQNMKGANALDAYTEAISKAEVPPDIQIYPQLAVAYLKWFDGKKEEALMDAQAVLAANPDDEVILLVAGMQSELKKNTEALATLDQIAARQGDIYKRAQQLMLKFAKVAEDKESAKKAALRLIALRPLREELNMLLPDLKQLGLAEQAAEVQRQMSKTSSRSNEMNEKCEILNGYCRDKKQAEAIELARALLANDPLGNHRNGDYYRHRSLEALNQFHMLDSYIADLEKQLAAAPDSARACLLLAEAWNRKDSKKSLEWYRKVVTLRPNDNQLKWKLIQSLRNQDKEEALKMCRDLIASDPSQIFDGRYDLLYLFREAKKLPELAELILAQKGTPNFSPNANNQSLWICQQLGQELRDESNDLDLAVKIWRKGIEIQPQNMMHAGMQLRPQIAMGLAALGRKDEALAEVDALFFPPAPAQKQLLGMSNFYGMSTWMSYSNYSNGKVEIPTLAALGVAEQFGGLDALRKKAEAKAEQDPSMKALALIIRIRQRDPQLLQDLPKLLADPKEGQFLQNNQMLLRVIAADLASWPQARRLCMEILFTVKKQVEMNPGDSYGTVSVRSQILKQALEFGEVEEARKALKEWQEARGNLTNNGFDSNESLALLRSLVSTGMVAECENLMTFFKNLPEAARNNYFMERLEGVRDELALQKGEVQNPQALAVPTGEEKGKTVILWQIQGSKKASSENPKPELIGHDLPKLDGRWNLELLAITAPNTVHRLALIPKAKSRGKWTGTLPEGLVSVEAVLYPVNGQEVAYRGIPIASLHSTNLLVNPDFEGLGDGNVSTKASIKGWCAVPEGAIQPGGPYSGSRQVFLKFQQNQTRTIRGEKIPLQAGKDYLQSAWMRCSPEGDLSFGMRFLDKDGKEIGNASCENDHLRQGKWGYVSNIYTTGRGGRGKRQINEKAAFMEPYIQARGDTFLNSLFLGTMETPACEKPTPKPTPTASASPSTSATPTPAPSATPTPQPQIAGNDFSPAARAYSFADTTGKLLVLWEISPTDSIEPGSSPILFSGISDPKLDGRFDLELVYRIPPNITHRLALIPAAKARGKWSGKLPADLRDVQWVLRATGKADGVRYTGPWMQVVGAATSENDKEKPKVRFNSNESIALIRSMANLSMAEECENLISIFKAIPEAMRDTHFVRQLEMIQGKLALQKGEVVNPQAVAAPLSEQNGQTVVLWEIHAAGKDATSVDFQGCDHPKLDGRWDLELQAITKPNHVQRLALVPKAKSRGTWTGALPEGLISIEAVLHPVSEKNVPGITYNGVPVPMLRATNLLTNPGFAGLKGLDSSSPVNLTGWEQVPAGIAQPGGPRPGATEALLRFPQQRNQVVLGEKIPVEPGKDYLQTAWLRNASGDAFFGVQYLDKDGKTVGKTWCNNDSLRQGHWGYVWQILTSGRGQGKARIHEKAVFLQPYIQARGDTLVSNALLKAVDVPGCEMPSRTPSPLASPSPSDASPAPSLSALATPDATPDASALSPVALACASADEDGKVVVIWETSLTDSRQFNPSHTLFEGVTDPKLDGRYDLELVYRNPPNAIQRLAFIPNAKTWGKWSGKMPTGVGSVQAILHPSGKSSPNLRYEGTWMQIVNAPNLLTNPTFATDNSAPQPTASGTDAGSAIAASTPVPVTVKGWENVPNFSTERGGPRPDGHYILFSNPNYAKTKKPVSVLSKKIEMKKGKDYTISGWTLYFGGAFPRIGFLLLDKDGKQIRRDIAGTPLSRKGKWSNRWLTITSSGGSEGRHQVPENTVYIQPFVEVNENLGLDGLFVGESDSLRSPF